MLEYPGQKELNSETFSTNLHSWLQTIPSISTADSGPVLRPYVSYDICKGGLLAELYPELHFKDI